ncbi:unnamed protein product, partial [Closterium sp. NIES-53]
AEQGSAAASRAEQGRQGSAAASRAAGRQGRAAGRQGSAVASRAAGRQGRAARQPAGRRASRAGRRGGQQGGVQAGQGNARQEGRRAVSREARRAVKGSAAVSRAARWAGQGSATGGAALTASCAARTLPCYCQPGYLSCPAPACPAPAGRRASRAGRRGGQQGGVQAGQGNARQEGRRAVSREARRAVKGSAAVSRAARWAGQGSATGGAALTASCAARTLPCYCQPGYLSCPAPACPAQYLLSDSRDSVSLFDHTFGASLAPLATTVSATRSQWLTRDAAACLAIRNHLPLAECAHFRQHKTAKALYSRGGTAALQDAMVTTTTPGGQGMSICTYTRTGPHLATFFRRPGSSLYTLATEPPRVAASAQVSASGPAAPPCSCRLLSHQTLLWHHKFGHPSLPCLRGMHSCLLVFGLPRFRPPLPPSPAPPCLPCIKGRQRAAPHSSSFPPTIATLQTLYMDVWGPACITGQGRECYFLLVVDDYTHYTTVFPLHSKGEVLDVLIPWIHAVRLQLRERYRDDLPILCLHADRSGEFSSDPFREFCRGEGILQSFTLPASPQQKRIAERRIGLVMEVVRTSMIHAAAVGVKGLINSGY